MTHFGFLLYICDLTSEMFNIYVSTKLVLSRRHVSDTVATVDTVAVNYCTSFILM